MSNRLLRIKAVCEKTTLSSSTIYKGIREGTFPRGRRIGGGGQAVAWLESEIVEWMERQPEANLDDWLTPDRKAGLQAARRADQ